MFRLFTRRIGNRVLHQSAVGVRIARPQFELPFGFFHVWRGEDGWLEIADLAMFVDDEIAVRVADGFSAAPVGADVADDRADLTDGILALKHQHHDTPPLFGFGIGREILEDVIADELLDTGFRRLSAGWCRKARQRECGGEHANRSKANHVASFCPRDAICHHKAVRNVVIIVGSAEIPVANIDGARLKVVERNLRKYLTTGTRNAQRGVPILACNALSFTEVCEPVEPHNKVV